MELLYANFLQTTTQVTVTTGTTSVANIFERDLRYQYASENAGTDATTTSMTIRFNETLLVERIALLGMNLKGFEIFYNGLTANTFALTSTSDTTTLNYASNSATSKYWQVTPVNCTSVTIDMKTTISPNAEKAIGFIAISRVRSDFDKIPTAQGYNPVIIPEQYVQNISDGGKRIHTVSNKFQVSISFENIIETFRNELKSVYDTFDEHIFVAFGTATGWDEILYEVVWPGNFNFYKFSDNFVNAGFSGSIELWEAPR